MSKNTKTVVNKLLIPELLIAFLDNLDKNPPQIVGYKRCRMEYIISTILTHKQEKHNGSYSVLNMRCLRDVVPLAHKYLYLLRDRGVIEWKEYSAGRNSRLYREKAPYKGHIIEIVLTDTDLLNRMRGCKKRRFVKNTTMYPELRRYVESVSMNFEAARYTVEEHYQYNLLKENDNAEARRTYSYGEINKLEAGQIFFSVSSTNGRLNTNFTRLPRELVWTLTIDGNHLAELDMANSQPFDAAGIFDPRPRVEQIMMRTIGSSLTMGIKKLELKGCRDVILYTDLVTSAEFYPYMMSKFEVRGIPFVDKDDFKDKLFTVFYGENNSIYYADGVRLFSELFPNVYMVFYHIKQRQHNTLAILFQRIESYVYLNCVCPQVLTAFPGLPFITKHDSLLPVESLISPIRDDFTRVVSDVIEREIGLRPYLRWKAQNRSSTTFPQYSRDFSTTQ